jgi:integrase
VKTRLLETNPIPHISIPRATTKQNALSGAQVVELLKHAGPLADLLWALSVTGARPGELVQATVEDCDADGAAVRLKASKIGKRIVWFPKSERKRLASIRAVREKGPLFPANKGGHWTQSRLNAEFRRSREAAKLPTWATPYSLRHTWITERLRKGMTDSDVARLAGTSIEMIRRHYGHLVDADIKRLADRL